MTVWAANGRDKKPTRLGGFEAPERLDDGQVWFDSLKERAALEWGVNSSKYNHLRSLSQLIV
jgi:hypothetical protein